MNIRKPYWVALLVLLLSFSLALPYCCHADISELFSHQEMSTEVMHGQHQDAQQCDCGHEFVKDFQKNKKVVSGQLTLLPLTDLSAEVSTVLHTYQSVSIFVTRQPGLLVDSGPSLHLLNSVFLN